MRLAAICLGSALASTLIFAQSPADKFDSGNRTGLPVYPSAVSSEHTDGRGTVSLVDKMQAHRLAASAYVPDDKPDKVLQFYRDHLKSKGPVVECDGGKNEDVDVQLNGAAFANPSICHPENIAHGGTQLKLVMDDEQKIVVVLPHGNGSEIALVSVKP